MNVGILCHYTEVTLQGRVGDFGPGLDMLCFIIPLKQQVVAVAALF